MMLRYYGVIADYQMPVIHTIQQSVASAVVVTSCCRY